MPRTSKKHSRPRPLLLVVLEGFGIAPAHPGNAILEAQPEYLISLMSHYPTLSLSVSPQSLGLSSGTAVDSEMGHIIIGTGALPYDSRIAIDAHIGEAGFTGVPALEKGFKRGRRVHLIGLVSTAQREASLHHLRALIRTAQRKGVTEIFLHAILDGRDSAPSAGKTFIEELTAEAGSTITVATICGRFYALDPYRRADRIAKAAEAIMIGKGASVPSAAAELERQYAQKIFDEEIPPTIVVDSSRPQSGDLIVFFDFNGESLRPLAAHISRLAGEDIKLISLTDYECEGVETAFIRPTHRESIGDVVAAAGLKQLRLADSEGFAAATAFLNGNFEERLTGEDRESIPLPVAEHYSDRPEMANEELTRRTLEAIEDRMYDFIAITLPGLDRLGHEGDVTAAIEGMASIDAMLKKIVTAALAAGGAAVITSTHGRAEQTISPLTETTAGHTSNPVPLLLVAGELAGYSLGLPQPVEGDLNSVPVTGTLLDIAPTVLGLLRLVPPKSMAGRNFFSEAQIL